MAVAVVLIGSLGSVTCHAETGINVDYHSQQEIRDYLKQKKSGYLCGDDLQHGGVGQITLQGGGGQ